MVAFSTVHKSKDISHLFLMNDQFRLLRENARLFLCHVLILICELCTVCKKIIMSVIATSLMGGWKESEDSLRVKGRERKKN